MATKANITPARHADQVLTSHPTLAMVEKFPEKREPKSISLLGRINDLLRRIFEGHELPFDGY